MSKNGNPGMKCHMQQRSKKTDNMEEVSVKKSKQVDIGNDSPKRNYDSRLSGHSTPIRKKDYIYEIEDSPELDYRCSPISLPCTQEGGNEIAWDWQIPVNKNSSEKPKSQSTHIETPKRTKQLQKKRNSNSPLLQKPLKRKQVKMENIENIGKLTAELKALTERMKSMQQNFDNDNNTEEETTVEQDTRLVIDLDSGSSDDAMLRVAIDNDKSKVGIHSTDSKNKKGSSYEDLFDDSIDDSMVKCSQEIEEKLNLCKSKGSDLLELLTVNVQKELSSGSEKDTACLVTSNNSTEGSKNSNTSKNSSSVNSSGHLKTYSNNTHKTNSIGTAPVVKKKDSSLRASYLNNNVINVQSGKHMLQEESMSEFPDDSFDDCLATCVEDDKMLSKLSEYDFNLSNTDHNLSLSKKISKQGTPSTVINKKISNNVAPKAVGPSFDTKLSNYDLSSLITDDLAENTRETIQQPFTGKTALENRKFFKTKSLSDQYFYQNKNFNSNCKVNKTVMSGQVSSNSVLSSTKRIQSNSSGSSVSNNFSTVKSQTPYESNHLPANNSMVHAHAFNRLEEKDAGNCIVKYKSTSNLCSTQEAAKHSQSVQCTPKEIERKRLEAKLRLEAKRKLQQNTQSEVPVNKSVKR